MYCNNMLLIDQLLGFISPDGYSIVIYSPSSSYSIMLCNIRYELYNVRDVDIAKKGAQHIPASCHRFAHGAKSSFVLGPAATVSHFQGQGGR